MALARLHICAGSSEHLLLHYIYEKDIHVSHDLAHTCMQCRISACSFKERLHTCIKYNRTNVQTVLEKKVEKVYTIYNHTLLFLFFRQGIYVDHSPGLSRQLEIYSWYKRRERPSEQIKDFDNKHFTIA